jgi:hypothetical protein
MKRQLRTSQRRVEFNVGGGSGGGPGGDRDVDLAGTYSVSANSVEFISRVPQAGDPLSLVPPGPNCITLLATGQTPVGVGPGGTVNLRGNQGVRITAGPPLGPLLPTASDSTDGVELAVAPEQKITLQQGLEQVGPGVEMSATGITIDGGLAMVTIQSLTSVTLQVAGGIASITLSPAGVEIKGLLVNIN